MYSIPTTAVLALCGNHLELMRTVLRPSRYDFFYLPIKITQSAWRQTRPRLNYSKIGLCKIRRIAYANSKMYETLSDEELMLQYKGGDAQSFEALYSRYRQPLFRYLQHQCGNAAIAEELFQDVWMNLIRTRDRYEVTASFKTFVYRMSHNRLIDHYRKNKHGIPRSYNENEEILNMEEHANTVSPQRTVEGLQQVEQLLDAIEKLPEAQREAFLLKENTDLSIEEIADITGTKPETAKSRIRYALNKIRSSIEFD